MLDDFDLALLDAVQRDDGQSANMLAQRVPLSPSAIARRLRRLRGEGFIARTVALLSPRLTADRLRAVVFIQLSEHADHAGKAALHRRLVESEPVQFCFDMTGAFDILIMIDCANMAEFNALTDAVLVADPTVRRYETSFVKREVKFAPFVRLSG
ncbi:MAG: Lrp/AsnC family transcriptional regulator [Sphingomonas sp.]|uniref:Lrp/AsnC family transcriptional regulator n=1 Tax=Sphingomonas sp. TaxID=28214 RepID=UPI00182AE6CD|nr:Lrp/AsnC family transcriptional regulator [Sphingomonas sp.]MBA3667277.1 Lrp/AsnC family transcriptional regulator [Sphingomonas sp.]